MKLHHLKTGSPSAQALVEFALTLPILLLLVLGAMDFGRMFYTKIVLTNAAREGANYLSYFPEDANNGYAATYAAIIDEANSSTVQVTVADVSFSGCCTRGTPVEVTVSRTVDLIFDGVLQTFGLLGGPVEITSSVRMMVQ
jgi:Flp pilus assembly protein TadG